MFLRFTVRCAAYAASIINMAHLINRAAIAGVRRLNPASVRCMSAGHGMSAAEELSMQKLYPGYRASWFGEPGADQNWAGTKQRWVIVEAYPLFAAIGLGCGICALHLARHLFFSPDVFLSKSNRGNAMIENHKEGENWKGNPLRIMGNLKSDKTDPFR